MKHDLQAFSQDIVTLIKTSGDSGGSGDKLKKPLQHKDFFVPTRETHVSPLEIEWGQAAGSSGDRKTEQFKSLAQSVPTVPTATTRFEEGRAGEIGEGAPAKWHAILAELKRRDPVEWLPADRWQGILSDAESFLSGWGSAAHSLGWTALDLFGVHPIAPAARFDAMGLILIQNGGPILTLTASTTTMRRASGAVLTYRRPDQIGAILLSESLP
ncbi:hypothetical protein [Bradyrhizobium sp. 191]|uniref:hypothetical protein n=1 Tax=Bradyrhizobium sp. 191 TaxID=2782659 RepID=UPI001FFE6880|nr:hypothetical protein [Bradyrhizobium sp. 191]UPJ63520.1 hypothetical protein IVB23_26315 [Bradyrhizobium sp. 191]